MRRRGRKWRPGPRYLRGWRVFRAIPHLLSGYFYNFAGKEITCLTRISWNIPPIFGRMDENTFTIDLGRPAADIIAELKRKRVEVPEWGVLVRDYEPELHRIVYDHAGRKDKARPGGVEKASRIRIGLEKLLTRRMTEFMFAIPVKRVYHNVEGSETRQRIAAAIESVYKHARTDTGNIRRGNAYFAACEVFTLWYAAEQPREHTLYGFPCRRKLKCRTYSPMEGVRLYPLFDDLGDMKAMSLEYARKLPAGGEATYFETYTATSRYRWRQAGGGWELAAGGGTGTLGKIPGVYAFRPMPVWHGLSYLRDEIEYTLSRNSDVVAYNSAPILKVSGGVQGGEDKGESRRVYRVSEGGDVDYVSWSQSVEALKYHVDTLLSLFWSQSQMPDISFEKMKSLGNIGFDARQTLLTDAHLRVGDESGPWTELFERETNVVKAFLRTMNPEWEDEMDNVEVEHVISPFIQNDEKAEIERRMAANGGRPVESHIESIRRYGRSSNPTATLEQIRQDEAAEAESRIGSIFEGGV